MLYFFHGQGVIVISHGFVKREAAVPSVEIARALRRKRMYDANPERYTYGVRA